MRSWILVALVVAACRLDRVPPGPLVTFASLDRGNLDNEELPPRPRPPGPPAARSCERGSLLAAQSSAGLAIDSDEHRRCAGNEAGACFALADRLAPDLPGQVWALSRGCCLAGDPRPCDRRGRELIARPRTDALDQLATELFAFGGCFDGDARSCDGAVAAALGDPRRIWTPAQRDDIQRLVLHSCQAGASCDANLRSLARVYPSAVVRPGVRHLCAGCLALEADVTRDLTAGDALRGACDRGEPASCAALGHALLFGTGIVDVDTAGAGRVLGLACDGGQTTACGDLRALRDRR